MFVKQFRGFCATPLSNPRDPRAIFWFSLSLTVTGIYCFFGVDEVFSGDYIFHDDARSHVFWMWRYLDPELFPGDWIADYFQSVAPHGYAALYRAMATIGIDPLSFNKVLPIALVFIIAGYCFWTSWELFPVPAAGFVATLFLNQNIWVTHDVASGTPRAFFYPLFLAFLYYLARRSLLPCLVAMALQGLFYPQCLFISCGILVLRLARLERGRLQLSRERQDYRFCAAGLGVAFLVLLPYAFKISDFGPVTPLAIARDLPILQSVGRKEFFYDNPWKFWVCGERCGMAPYDWCKFFPPPQAWLALFLPFLLQAKRFPLATRVSSEIAILPRVFFSSLGMFFLAHALLFRLHLPSRYTKHSLRILVALAAGIAVVLIVDAVSRALERRSQWLALGFFVPLLAILLGYPPLLREYPNPDYVRASAPPIYEFFERQPKDILVASLSEQANNIPLLSKRSNLVSSEITNPYHWGYYREIERRSRDLVQAQYSPSLTAVKDFIQAYDVDFWLLDSTSFEAEYIEGNPWLSEIEPFAPEAIARARRGELPALASLQERCAVFEAGVRVILEARCIRQAE